MLMLFAKTDNQMTYKNHHQNHHQNHYQKQTEKQDVQEERKDGQE
jgi:hypothetical protein